MINRTDTSYANWLQSPRSVSGRIAIGFGIVLVLHLSIAVLGHYGLTRADQKLHTQNLLRERVQALYDIDRSVGDLQRNVLLFAFTGYRGPQLRALELQEELERLLDDLQEQRAGPGVAPDILTAMHDRLDTHREIFAAVATDRARRKELVEVQLALLADQIESLLTGLASSHPELAHLDDANSDFDKVRLAVLQFVHSPDSTRVMHAKTRISAIRHGIGEAGGSAPDAVPQIEQTIKLLDQYETAFLEMVQATRGYLHLVNVVLAGQAQEFARLATDARNTFDQQATTMIEDMIIDSTRFRRINNMFSVLTIVLGVIAAGVISRQVAPPLNDIAATLDRLSRGETCATIPGLGRKDELGRLAGAAQVFKDKAEETEALLREANRVKELERRLAHSQKLESVGQLATGIAHEINTPLQCVVSSIEFLKRSFEYLMGVLDQVDSTLTACQSCGKVSELKKQLASRRCQHARQQIPATVGDASNAVERVVEIIRAMKMMAHPGHNELKTTDIVLLIRNAVTITRNRWKQVAEVRLELEDGLHEPMALTSEISQVLMNLLINAADAIAEVRDPDGPAGVIWVRAKNLGSEHICIEVEDTGPGVPHELQHRIFDPFFTTKEIGKGTGQGLALSHTVVVEHHSGALRVEGGDAGGARFSVTLPLDPTRSPAVEDALVEAR